LDKAELEAELIPLAKRERRMAERAYFANRLNLLIRLKCLRTQRARVEEAAEQLPLFPSGLRPRNESPEVFAAS
jgi:hypothetical protein